MGILNRFDTSLDDVLHDEANKNKIRSVSIGLTTELKEVEKLVEKNYLICIDTANANNSEVLFENRRSEKEI